MPKDHHDAARRNTRRTASLHHAIAPRADGGYRRPSHPEALHTIAAGLPAGASIRLATTLRPGLAEGAVTLDASLQDADADVTAALADAFPEALRLAFPGHAVVGAAATAQTLFMRPTGAYRLPVPRLDPTAFLRAVGLESEVGADRPGPLPRPAGPLTMPEADRVRLPHPHAAPVSAAGVLLALTAVGRSARLVIVLRPLRPEAFVLRQIAALQARIEERLDAPLVHLFAQRRLLPAWDRLRGWTELPPGAAGVGADVHVEIAGSPSAPLRAALAAAAQGAIGAAAAERGSTADAALDSEAGAVDLSMGWPLGTIPRVLLPTGLPLRRVVATMAEPSPGGVGGLAAAGEPGVDLGLDAVGRAVCLRDATRGQHVYLCGATGTGKSSLIRRMVRDDVARGFGVGVIDTHGDLVSELSEDLSRAAPPAGGIVLADLSDPQTAFRLNLLAASDLPPAMHASFVANQLIAAFKRILYGDVSEAFGPMFESYFRNALMLLMLGSNGAPHLGQLERVFTDRHFRKALLDRCPDEVVRRFWADVAEKVTNNEISLQNLTPYITSKLTQLTGNPMLRPVLCSAGASFEPTRTMQEGGVMLANLAKGFVGETEGRLMGALLTTKLFATAMARGRLPRAERRPFRLYLDEFQTYATDVVAHMLAEGRKFGLELTLANQSLGQIDGRAGGPDVAHAVLANSATVVAFRAGPRDAGPMAEWLGGDARPAELTRLPDHHAIARLPGAGGVPATCRFQTFPV